MGFEKIHNVDHAFFGSRRVGIGTYYQTQTSGLMLAQLDSVVCFDCFSNGGKCDVHVTFVYRCVLRVLRFFCYGGSDFIDLVSRKSSPAGKEVPRYRSSNDPMRESAHRILNRYSKRYGGRSIRSPLSRTTNAVVCILAIRNGLCLKLLIGVKCKT